MTVITPAELRNNMRKYLDMAKTEKVIIRRGRTESFVLSAESEESLAPNDDLARAIPVDEFFDMVKEDIRVMYNKRSEK